MPAKWQQWMPFRIDAFKGSPVVQAMHPSARAGYLYLLSKAWQTEDCTVSADPMELAEDSGLGDELWAQFGPRILRKFEVVNGNGRLRNVVCFQEWSEAKRVYEKRAKAAEDTNAKRSPSDNGTVTVEINNGHRTPTVYDPVYVGVSVPVSVPVNGLSPEMVARGLAERLGLSLGFGPTSFNTAVTEVAATELKQGKNLEDLTTEMEAAYRFFLQEKPQLRIAWGPAKFFGEGHWRSPDDWPRKEKTRAQRIAEWHAKEDDDDDEGA